MEEGELRRLLEDHERWLSSDESEGCRADLSGVDLRGKDLSGVNLRGAFLKGALLDNAILANAQLIHADLSDARLLNADLRQADLLLADFTGADLSGADLSDTTRAGAGELGHIRRGPRFKDANLRRANLSNAACYYSDFSGSNLEDLQLAQATLEGANLADSDLNGLNLSGADLTNANLQRSDLNSADLRRSRMVHVDLRGARLSNADVRSADLRSANLGNAEVVGILYDRTTKFRGIRVETCFGSSRFRRFAQDQDFIEEFKEAHPGYYRMWLWLTDCGRSMLRVVLWSSLLILGFGVIYFAMGADAFNISAAGLPWNLFTTSYYSLVTFTTLGFGDITPNTPLAAGVVMLEVLVGYVMLGIVISILATKVARRS
jgi:uncharacterized protein YjbI with pentapeptide repeats